LTTEIKTNIHEGTQQWLCNCIS